MTVSVKLTGGLKDFVDGADRDGSLHISLRDSDGISDVRKKLHIPQSKIGITIVNKKAVREDIVLHDGDSVIFYPLVAGG